MKLSDKELFDNLPEPIASHIQHLERMRQDFVANVSHELRTPLTVIRGYLEALLEQSPKENTQFQKALAQMYQQSDRMQHVIEDLLLLADLEGGETEGKPEQLVAVSAMLKTICRDAEEFSASKNHQIHLKTDDTLKIKGIADELRSLFSNVIFNAVKYTPAEGRIYINWYHEGDQAILTVRDTGIGIAEKHIPRLTERFYRVDKARSRASGGTGLGLAIVKHVLIRHGGSLEIKSELGKGSVFSCIFLI